MNAMRYPLILIVTTVTLVGADLRYFNPGILGKPASEPVALLLPGNEQALHPFAIRTELHEGRYSAAAVSYPKGTPFEEVRDALNELYKDYEVEKASANPMMGIWRNEEKGYSVGLFEEDDAIRVVYFSLMGIGQFLNHLEDAYPDRNPLELIRRGLEADLDKSATKEPASRRD